MNWMDRLRTSADKRMWSVRRAIVMMRWAALGCGFSGLSVDPRGGRSRSFRGVETVMSLLLATSARKAHACAALLVGNTGSIRKKQGRQRQVAHTWRLQTNAESLRCGVSKPVSPSSQHSVRPCSQNVHAFFSANHQKGRCRFCQLDRLLKWNNYDDRGSSRGDRRRYFQLLDLLLRSALHLSVNLNCYGTKVATHLDFADSNT